MKASLIALSLLLPQALFAQTVTRAAFATDRVPVNQPATATIDFERTDRAWCGLRIIFGDGEVREMRVEQVPVVVTKAYAHPGTYAMNIEGTFVKRGLKSAIACSGNATSGQLTVFDPADEERKAQAAQAARAAKAAEDARLRAAEERLRALQAQTAELERQHQLQLERERVKKTVPVLPADPKAASAPVKGPPKPPALPASKPRDKVPVF